jgi:hypothetical protein
MKKGWGEKTMNLLTTLPILKVFENSIVAMVGGIPRPTAHSYLTISKTSEREEGI